MGSLLKSIITGVVLAVVVTMVPGRGQRQRRPDHRQRRHHRHRPRLRRPEPGQRLPVRHVHDLRGPVRRRRRRRPRGGRRHRRGGQPAGDPPPRRQRHGLVRPQRRDHPGRQHEPELGPQRPRHHRRLPRGPGEGTPRAPGGRPRPVGGRGLQGPDHRGARGVGRRGAGPRRRDRPGDPEDRPDGAVGGGPRDAASGSRPASTTRASRSRSPSACVWHRDDAAVPRRPRRARQEPTTA